MTAPKAIYSAHYPRDEIAFKGKCKVIYGYNKYFGNGKIYCSKILNSPTWNIICGCASAGIKRTHDYHHIYFENINDEKQNIKRMWFLFRKYGSVKLLELQMGS